MQKTKEQTDKLKQPYTKFYIKQVVGAIFKRQNPTLYKLTVEPFSSNHLKYWKG